MVAGGRGVQVDAKQLISRRQSGDLVASLFVGNGDAVVAFAQRFYGGVSDWFALGIADVAVDAAIHMHGELQLLAGTAGDFNGFRRPGELMSK